MIRVLSAHAGADTGGVGLGLAGAFRRLMPSSIVSLRSTVRSSNYIAYPTDAPWSDAEHHAARADVLHLHNTFRTAGILGQPNKPLVIHHHGTHYRDNALVLNLETQHRQAAAVVSTLDLLEYGDDLAWVPAAYDLAWLRTFRQPQGGRRIRVGHAPTDRAIKSTDAFLAACAKLSDLVEPVLIERRTWAECLELKGTCDVLFDQVQLGYGGNAIEAWAMGIPVIAGAPASTLARMYDTFPRLPFVEADETTIGDAIEALLDSELRRIFGDVGTRHVERWHDGRETVARLTPIYEAQAELA